jgi:RecA/RadA recombinase
LATDFFKKFVDDIGDPETALASDGTGAAEFTGFIDTGSYIFNAALSGTLFGGFPNNKGIVLAGDPATGKTFFALSLVKYFLETHADARVFYFDTESAVTNQMLVDRGIDTTRVAKSEPVSLENFRTVAITVLDKYKELPEDKRFPMLMVLDSLSMLPSNKELTDTADGSDTKDMTKAPVIKGIFRVLRSRMSKLQVPLIVTNHIYSVIGAYMPTKEMGGGSGAKYAADTIVFLSKAKEKDDEKHVVGNVITVTMKKSRITKEETRVKTRILFDGGLDRYYGLLDHAVAAGLIEKVSTKYKFPDGKTYFEKAINREPAKYFTDDLLKQLDTYIADEFRYTNKPIAESDDDSE